MKLKVLDLFSGIGGFSLGLERTGGFETVAFCEIEPFCRRVLAKHWPHVRQYEDVRELTARQLAADGIVPDVICGGFPCQDISIAGRGVGIEGSRSGLWKEYARLIGELRPELAIVENVSALLGRGLDVVLGDLASLGYDAEWHCIPASAVGAPHRRDRLWVVANTERQRFRGSRCRTSIEEARGSQEAEQERQWLRADTQSSGQGVSYSSSQRLPLAWALTVGKNGEQVRGLSAASSWWATEPAMGRVAYGIPNRVDRLRSLGNAVVPQIPEIIGRAILEARAA